MKKIYSLLMPLAMLCVASCGGAKSEQTGEATFTSPQPFESGEYRIESYQFADTIEPRVRFDGRMMVALSPEGSGIYMYENGNRTHFTARFTTEGGFEQKSDSLYEAADAKSKVLGVKKGAELDTVIYVYKGRPVKIAFDRTPLSKADADEMWRRITSKLSK